MVKKSGFSLIELTVVIGLLSLLILAISSTMLMSIMSSNRIRTSTKVKQAGDYALGQIQSMLRSAKSIKECNTGSSTITIINQDGGQTQFANTLISEFDPIPKYRIASNSGFYLTPSNTNTFDFSLTCIPSDEEPTLIKLSFDLQDTLTTRATENPLIHFETSINLRNE